MVRIAAWPVALGLYQRWGTRIETTRILALVQTPTRSCFVIPWSCSEVGSQPGDMDIGWNSDRLERLSKIWELSWGQTTNNLGVSGQHGSPRKLLGFSELKT
jgi:hypothetical protein